MPLRNIIDARNANVTLGLSHLGALLRVGDTSVVTIPQELPVGFNLDFLHDTAGDVTITAADGVLLNGTEEASFSVVADAGAYLVSAVANEFWLVGVLEAAG
jgi:hypothetical protein